MTTSADGVVIIGAGHGGFQAAVALRHAGFDDRIRLVDGQGGLPYERPPLSKEFLAGKVTAGSLCFGSEEFYERLNIELMAGERAAAVDRSAAQVELASGRRLSYDHLILATGASVRRLPGDAVEGVLTLRTLPDAEQLAERLRTRGAVVIVGGGFIGLELASVAASAGAQVAVIEALPGVMSRIVSTDSASIYASEHMKRGARICTSTRIDRFRKDRHGHVAGVETDDGQRLDADLVIVAIGVLPNVQLAVDADLPVRDGILVDEYLRTTDPRISAIGDCARYPSRFADDLVRLESVQNASDQAHCVANRLVGRPHPFSDVPWFWSDQYDLKLQIAGLTAGHDETVTTGDVEARNFSVMCFSEGRFVGAESVNRPGDHMAARRLLAPSAPDRFRLTREQLLRPDFDLRAYAKASAAAAGERAK